MQEPLKAYDFQKAMLERYERVRRLLLSHDYRPKGVTARFSTVWGCSKCGNKTMLPASTTEECPGKQVTGD